MTVFARNTPELLGASLRAAGLPAEGELAGKAVLVTGGSMGIGLACARASLEAGARVTIAARAGDALEDAVARLSRERAGAEVHAIRADVSQAQDVARLIEGVAERFGSLDGVVHAAAVLGPIGSAVDADPAAWLETLRINLFGSFLVATEAARAMRSSGGRIVLLSGGGGTSPFPNYSAYACSKVGVVRLVENLALELEPDGISVNALAPGFVATRMHQATLDAGERAGEEYLRYTREGLSSGGVVPDVAARAAVFLLSERSRGITGKLLAAPWDEWWRWPERLAEVRDGDLFTLRRVVPRDRGGDWQ